MEYCVITIDGPGGAGKSTIARILAKRLGLFYLDTGAMYRAVALKAKELNLSPENQKSIAQACEHLCLEFHGTSDPPKLLLEGRDVSLLIRTAEMDMLSSTISALPQVREAMVKLQRNMAKSHGKIVAEGRDMGTVVFPDACTKFFLTASPKERAYRRYAERKARGELVTIEEVEQELHKRDKQDQTRSIAPLKPAKDAIIIDTTGLGIDAVMAKIMDLLEKKSCLGVVPRGLREI